MSKKLRQLLVGVGVLLVVALLVTGITLIPVISTLMDNTIGTTSSNTSTTSNETISIIDRRESDVKDITLKNENGTFEIYPVDDDGTRKWNVRGYETLKIITSVPYNVAEYAYSLKSVKTIGEVSDLEEYGLKTPVATMDVEYNDGTTEKIYFGKNAAGSESRRYVKLESDSKVYLLERAMPAEFASETIINCTLFDLTVPEEDSSVMVAPKFDYITISGPKYPEPLKIIHVDKAEEDVKLNNSAINFYEYFFVEPRIVSTHLLFSDQYLLPLSQLTADHIAVITPSAAELTEYGFDEATTVAFRIGEKDYSLKVGLVGAKYSYVMIEGQDVIFTVKNEDIEIGYKKMHEMRDSFVSLVEIRSISKYTFEIAGDSNKYVFTNKRVLNATSGTSSNSTPMIGDYTYTYLYNGEVMGFFPDLYEKACNGYREEDITNETVKGDLLFTITYEYFSEYGTKDTVIKVYECENNDRRVVYEVDGQDDSLIRATWAEEVTEALYKVIDGIKP